MIEGDYTLKPHELCFRRIGDYAETLGCNVVYYYKTAHIFYCGKLICRIWYNCSDFREEYIVDLAYQYIPYTKWEKIWYYIKRFFGKAEKNEVLIHKSSFDALSKCLIPDHYELDKETMDSYINKDYFINEEKLKNLIKFYVTENVVNEKLYLNGLRIKQINEDF